MNRPRDSVALILAGCAGIAVLVLTVAAVLDSVLGDHSISAEYATLLTGTLGVLIGALAGYIGGRRGDTGDTGDKGDTGKDGRPGRHALPDYDEPKDEGTQHD